MDYVIHITPLANMGALPLLSIVPWKANFVCLAIARILYSETEMWTYMYT